MDGPARLPDSRVAKSISSLKVGERGFTTPDAVVVDGDHGCWLTTSYIVYAEFDFSYPVEIRRDEGGYVVDISGLSETYRWWAADDCLPDDRDVCAPILKLIDDDDDEAVPCGITSEPIEQTEVGLAMDGVGPQPVIIDLCYMFTGALCEEE